jgi:hypothetical protein
MDWKTLSSSLIDSAAYDEEEGTLFLQFHQGRRYAYSGIDQRTADKLFESSSSGLFFHRHIKPYYEGTEITED